ncbi:MAG: hypothetical protein WA539_07975, partial [Candidatus Sulfotelmatobacter sp.]
STYLIVILRRAFSARLRALGERPRRDAILCHRNKARPKLPYWNSPCCPVSLSQNGRQGHVNIERNKPVEISREIHSAGL